MKRLLSNLSLIALLCAGSSAALAQATAPTAPAAAMPASDDFEKQLQAFQQKTGVTPANAMQQQTGGTVSPPPTPAVTPDAAVAGTTTSAGTAPAANPAAPPPLASPLGSHANTNTDNSDIGGGANPLGPAANLPLGKQMPLTANALGMQAPAESPEQQEAKMQARKKKMEDQIFNEAVDSILPMSPEEIRKLLDTFKLSRQAAETPITEPTPVVKVETVSLDPSQVPPVIRTSPGRVTTLTVLDSTGAPWPIQDVSWAGKFDVTPPEEGGNVVRITPSSAHNVGNVSMRLVDLITPITFTLKTGLDVVDYRFDARIPKQGPLAKVPLIEHGGLKTVVGTDENLVAMLDGTPPSGAEKMKVEGTDGRSAAWKLNGKMYLRTPLTLLSPAWSSSVSSADGMNVFVLNNTPVVLLSDEGRVVRASIGGSEVTP